ncbi:Ribosomal L1 domain-containing protein 1 [Araneus ventricosus]|uniref:Ribosomal L1 domain-containing protein 1 n=1 Tax=Araneus ventricosus TaxID=182803 RepID=A0A4Y2C544_ARAVE|nr:Ribosomal L1 domain-containing protein 1 [Araneus ventricosus]
MEIKKVKEAVNALKLLNKKFVEEDLKKQPLLEETAESPIYLQVMLKKIPPPQLIRMIRMPLPHSLVSETSEVCLITGDLEKRNHKAEVEPTVLHYKDLLRKHGVTVVSQVIPLRQLRTEYKTFESKRQLVAAYDVFLVDKKIAGVMAKTLGKSFFQSRKFPVQIDMRRPNLKDQIDKALCQTEFSLTCRGNSYALEVARLSMEDEAIIENIKTCIEVLENKLPGNRENILSLYVKTAKSKAVPIYVSLDIPDDILIKKPRKNEKYKLDELSTIDNAEVKVFRDGRVILRKMKKETNGCEDAAENDKKMNLNEPFPDDDLMESEEDTQESMSNEGSLKKKKKKVSDVTEIANNSEMENEENIQDSAKASRKRKKKSKKSADLVEVATNTLMGNEEDTQESISNEGSLKKKKKKVSDVTEITNNSEMENEEDIQDSAKTSRKRKKKSKKSADLVEITTNTGNEEDNQDSTTNKVSPKKKKKGKKYTNVDDTTDIVEIENEDIQDSVTAEISPKKKKKGRKSILGQFSDKTEIKSEEEIKNSPSIHASSKKKNKKNRNSLMNT